LKFQLFLSAALLLASPALAAEAGSGGVAAGDTGAASDSGASPDAGPDAGDEIVVLASGFSQPASQTGQAISVLGAARLAELQSPTIADALRTLPSLSVIQRGPVGAQTSVFVRGGNSSQTLVLIDGVRVNDPSSPNAAFDFGGLVTGNIARIEVLRGPNSIIWGSQAIGGIVNIETERPAGGLAVSAGAEGGSYETFSGHANLSGRSGAIGYSLGGTLYRTDGFSMLPGSAETDGSRQSLLNGRLTVELAANLRLDLRANYASSRNDYDSAFSGGADSLAVARNRQWFAYAGLDLDLADGRWRNRLAWTRADIDRVGTDPVVFSFNNYVATGLTDRFEYRGAYDLSDAVAVVAGLEHERVRTSTSFEGFPADLARNTVTGAYAQLILRPLAGLTLTGGARHDAYSDYGGHTTFGANAAWTPNGGRTLVRATYAEGFRAPTLTEGQPPYGNTALKPETARNVDLGVEQAVLGDAVRASATWFRRRSTNLIVYSFATSQSENVGRADAEGFELGLTLRPTARLHLEAGYAFVDAFNRSQPYEGKRLQLRPQQTATLSVDWQTPVGLKLGASLQMVGDSFDDAANTVRLDGYALAALRASVPLGDRFELYGRIENLTDATYQVVSGYATPGRSAYLGARARF